MKKSQFNNVKKCICSRKDPAIFENKAGFIIGITFNILLALVSLLSVVFYVFDIDKSWILLAAIWTVINAIDFIVSFVARRSKGHTKECSMRYAKINVFYSGVLF